MTGCFAAESTFVVPPPGRWDTTAPCSDDPIDVMLDDPRAALGPRSVPEP